MIQYYLCHPRGIRSMLTVLEYNTDAHDLDDFVLYSDVSISDLSEAITLAKQTAAYNNMQYQHFEHRY